MHRLGRTRASRSDTQDRLGRNLKHGTVRETTKFAMAKTMDLNPPSELLICLESAASSRLAD